MRFLMCAVLFAFAAIAGSQAQAGVYGSAILTSSNMVVQFSQTLNGTYTDLAFASIVVTRSEAELLNTARLEGFPVVQTSGFGNTFGGTVDAVEAFNTSGAESSLGQNNFSRTVPLPAVSAFSRADSLINGSLVDGIGLNTFVVAEIEAFDNTLGSSTASTGSEARFNFSTTQEGFYRLKFDATADLLVSSIGPPALRTAFAETSLTIQVNGADVSLDSPESSVRFAISGNDSKSVNFTGLLTDSIFLQQDTIHSLTIGHVARTRLEAVPEPASMLAFAGIVVAGGLGLRRRKRGANA